VQLTRREFDLLETLLANPGRAYTRDQLLGAAWESRYVSEKTIDVHIVALRRKFGDALRISTLRGIGYRLEPMIERLTSLRVWLLVAMLATAVVTLVAGNFVVNRLSASSARAADQAKALVIARAIASQVHGGAGVPQLRALQQMLPNDQIVAIRHSSMVFAGPPRASRPLELTVRAPLPGGQVILRDHQSPAEGGLAQETLVAGVIAVLIIGEAWLAATVLVRTVRKPVGRAIGTADRLAAGDFSATDGRIRPGGVRSPGPGVRRHGRTASAGGHRGEEVPR
jgi:hypothetical protein